MSPRRLADRIEALRGRVEFELDGRRFVVPQHPLLDWLAALISPEPDAVVPGLLDPDDQLYLYDRLTDFDAPLEVEVVAGIGEWVIGEVADRAWWEARRAAAEALADWGNFDAWALGTLGATDPLELPLRRFCNLVIRWVLTTTPDEVDRETWLTRFSAPPPGEAAEMERRPEWAEEETGADFGAAMASWSAIAAARGAPEG